MHQIVESKIHYYGTPVVLLSSLNEDGSTNLAPMSSAWCLGQSCMLGLGSRGKTFANLVREREIVINFMSADLVAAVDRLALTTGMHPVPEYKQAIGVEFVKDKFARAQLTPLASDLVKPFRVAECQISLEGQVQNIHTVGAPDQHHSAIEIKICRTHCDERLLNREKRHYIDPDIWNPLIMNFLEFYSLTRNMHSSRLAKVF